MREIMRSLLSANLTVTGILMFIGSIIVFSGSVYLINSTNVGKRLGFLITGAATFGWGVINSIFFILYAPRGPAPASIDGLNAFEIRIIPITFLIGSSILFIMFLLDMNRFETVGIIKNQPDYDEEKLEEFMRGIELLRDKKTWSKIDFINLYQALIPDFSHKETGKYLDQRM